MKFRIIFVLALLPLFFSCNFKGDKGDTGPIGPGTTITTYTGTLPTVPAGDISMDYEISTPAITANSIVSVIYTSDSVNWENIACIARNTSAKTITCITYPAYEGLTYNAIIQNPN